MYSADATAIHSNDIDVTDSVVWNDQHLNYIDAVKWNPEARRQRNDAGWK